tara:strand:- start:15963 stop:16415 length:453 start_codon:yes stop_codon:yes gene_type:complete
MTYFKTPLPQITLKYKSGDIKRFKIKSSTDSEEAFRLIMNNDTLEIQEEFVAIFLNNSNNSIGWFRLSTGAINASIVDVRLLMVAALQCGASSMIIAHNHPSGSLKPSIADKLLTEKLVKASKFLEIKLLDHLIITPENGFFSFIDEGLI